MGDRGDEAHRRARRRGAEIPAGEAALRARAAAAALAAVSWLACLAAVAAGYPGLRGDGETARAAQDIARGTAGGAALASSVAAVDRGALPAAAAFVIATGYLGLWSLKRLSAAAEARTVRPGGAAGVLAGTLAGQGAALAAIRGHAPLAFVTGLLCLGAAAGALAALAAREPPRPIPRARPLRLAGLFAAGLVLLASAFPADLALAALTRQPQFPEAWFPIAVALGARGGGAGALAVAGGLAVAALALETARSRCGGTGLASFAALAPAAILLLGPMSPFKGAAAALTAHALFRAGAGPALRAAALLAPSAAFVAASLLL